jgi:Transposase IS66 family
VGAACWAHARRKFFDAVKLNPKDTTSIQIAAQMDELFEIDAQARKQGLKEDRQLVKKTKRGWRSPSRCLRRSSSRSQNVRLQSQPVVKLGIVFMMVFAQA